MIPHEHNSANETEPHWQKYPLFQCAACTAWNVVTSSKVHDRKMSIWCAQMVPNVVESRGHIR